MQNDLHSLLSSYCFPNILTPKHWVLSLMLLGPATDLMIHNALFLRIHQNSPKDQLGTSKNKDAWVPPQCIQNL